MDSHPETATEVPVQSGNLPLESMPWFLEPSPQRLVVQKYGGSSVADAESIRRVAERVAKTRASGNNVVVVVSAMGHTTDDLLELANQVASGPSSKDLDALLTTGERISTALLAIALAGFGVASRTFSGSKAGLVTDGVHGNAHIVDVQPDKIQACLARGNVAIVAGFQGRSRKKGTITTLGRGGSDLTAVALAAALRADVCEIYTDVDGVYTADPRIVPRARKIDVLSSDEMLELAAAGAKVLNLRCVEYARRFLVPIHVRSSFSPNNGTVIIHTGMASDPGPVPKSREQTVITGVACERSSAKITVVGAPNGSETAARIFQVLAEANLNLDMIVQNDSGTGTDCVDVTFTLPAAARHHIVQTLTAARGSIGFERLHYDDQIGKLSLIGLGMRTDPHITATFFRALSCAGINIELISTSEVRVEVAVRESLLDDAARAVDEAFGLNLGSREALTGI